MKPASEALREARNPGGQHVGLSALISSSVGSVLMAEIIAEEVGAKVERCKFADLERSYFSSTVEGRCHKSWPTDLKKGLQGGARGYYLESGSRGKL